ncbi:MAG: DUF1800 family protein [Planctomycetota bacterium]
MTLSTLRAAAATLAVAGAPICGQALDPQAFHVVSRTSFGHTLPILQAASQPGGIAAYLQAQLNPAAGDNATATALVNSLGTITTLDELQQLQAVLACFSDHQLREVMTQFWERHFNTNFGRIRQVVLAFGGTDPDAVAFEAESNALFRQHALGTFYDLLVASSLGRAMNAYLNLFANKIPIPNEDFARECLELHTVGLKNLANQDNYTHNDIEALASCFSGVSLWRSSLPGNLITFPASPTALQRVFIADWHDYNSKVLFGGGGPIPQLMIAAQPQNSALGQRDAYTVLWFLANADATKEFVCDKLIRFFLGDDANEPTLRTQCMASWGSNGGDLRAVLTTLLNSSQFQGTTYRRKRLRNPMEYAVGVVRALGGTVSAPSDLDALLDTTTNMGMDLFGYPSPDGFPNDSYEQTGTQIYMDATGFAKAIHRRGPPYANPPYQGTVAFTLPTDVATGIGTLVTGGSATNPLHVAEYFLRRMYVDDWNSTDLIKCARLVAQTENGLNQGLNVGNPPGSNQDYQGRIDLLAFLVASLPQAFKK